MNERFMSAVGPALANALRSLALPCLLMLSFAGVTEDSGPSVELNVFWSVDCPHCISQKPFLAELAERHPELTIHDDEIEA